jgi:hypothetical protein
MIGKQSKNFVARYVEGFVNLKVICSHQDALVVVFPAKTNGLVFTTKVAVGVRLATGPL